MAAGYRSLLAPWAGGGGAAPVTARPGFRSPLAPWLGGASAPAAAATSGGYRSLLAFWLGGASAGAAVVQPPAPAPGIISPGGGGRKPKRWAPSPAAIPARDEAREELLQQEDDLMLQIIIQAVTRGLL